MKEEIITRISNNEVINLKELSIEDLYKLHFEEEKFAANLLKQMPPFSKERYDFLNKSYDLIEKIKTYRNELENQKNIASAYDVKKDYLYNIFMNTKKKMKREKLVVLELGCGKCQFIERISNLNDVKIYGCDLHPKRNLTDKKITIYKDTILNTLNKFKDNSIDIIIADNVCEHFFIDEIDVIYSIINKKLNKNGKIIFIIPNKNVGPCDISKKFLKMGETAVGFHFMEQTYKENINMFKKYGLYTDFLCINNARRKKDKRKFFLIYNFINIPDSTKIFMEKYLAKLPEKIRMLIFFILGYHIYILRKK